MKRAKAEYIEGNENKVNMLQAYILRIIDYKIAKKNYIKQI